MESKGKRDYILEKILDNNYNLYMLISRQVKVLEEYEKEVVGEVHKNNYIESYNEMLNLVGITTDVIKKEWDDETDRKS